MNQNPYIDIEASSKTVHSAIALHLKDLGPIFCEMNQSLLKENSCVEKNAGKFSYVERGGK